MHALSCQKTTEEKKLCTKESPFVLILIDELKNPSVLQVKFSPCSPVHIHIANETQSALTLVKEGKNGYRGPTVQLRKLIKQLRKKQTLFGGAEI